MAKMIMPRDRCRSDGERIIFDFFQKHFPDEFMIWTNVELIHTHRCTGRSQEAEIDFVVHHKTVGVLLLEVKDWRVEQIQGLTPDRVIHTSGKTEKNPGQALKDRLYLLKEKCESRNELCEHRKFLKFGIHTALCLPFISEQEWRDKLATLHVNLDDIRLPITSTLFREHFTDESLLVNPNRAVNKLCNMRKRNIPSYLDMAELDYLSTVLGAPDDEDSLVSSMVQETVVPLGSEDALIRMDEEQEKIATEYLSKVFQKPGHLIIEGVAGSGKTLLLQHMFSQLARLPDTKVAYIGRQRELIDEFRYNLLHRSINLDDPRFLVGTYYDLFRTIFGEETWRALPRKGNFPDEKAFAKFISDNQENIEQQFDFMLIDEGHNLPDPHIVMCVCATHDRENGNVVFVEDPEQNIYDTERFYDRTRLRPERKVHLTNNYRNTTEISQFALQMSDKYVRTLQEPHRLASVRHGPLPTVAFNADSAACALKILSKYQEWVKDGFSPDEIAVIYPMSDSAKDEQGNVDKEGLLQHILKCFWDSGVAFSHRYWKSTLLKTFGQYAQYIVSRPDPTDLEQYEKVRKSSVNLVTSFSSQGLTYRCAIVVMDRFGAGKWSKRVEQNLVYITLTRATSELMISFHKETDFYRKAVQILGEMRGP